MTKNRNKSSGSYKVAFKTILTKNQHDHLLLFSKLKAHESFRIKKELFIEFLNHTRYNKYLLGNALPIDIKSLRGDKSPYNLYNFKEELDWNIISFLVLKEKINDFIFHKKKYEKNIIIGNFKGALEDLDYVDNNICFSGWSLENHFVVYDMLGGIEKNKEYLSHINSFEPNAIFRILAYYFSYKAEKNTSAARYNDSVKVYMSNLKDSPEFYNYLLSKIDFVEYLMQQCNNYYNSFLAFEYSNSIIDRYIMFRSILLNVSLYNNKDIFSSDIIESSIKNIHLEICDPMTSNINRIYHPRDLISPTSADKNFIVALDYYTKGLYEESISYLEKLLIEFPEEIILSVLYIKSFLNIGSDFKRLFPSDSYITQIQTSLYNILQRNDKTQSSYIKLMKVISSCSSTDWSMQLLSYILESEKNANCDRNYLRLLNSRLLNPYLYKLFSDKTKSFEYIDNLYNLFPKSDTIELITHIFDSNSNLSELSNNIPLSRLKKYDARKSYAESNYDAALETFTNLINSENCKLHDFFEVFPIILDTYYKLKKFDEYIKFYVNNFIQNENSILRINTNLIINQIVNSNFKFVSPDICLPIFFSITNQDPHKIYLSAKKYMDKLKISKPSLIYSDNIEENMNFVILFLKNVCIPDVLKFSIIYENIEDVLTERLEICEILEKIDAEHKDLYKYEKSNITKEIIIMEGIHQVDESKIYVDVDGIKKNDLRFMEESFNRYADIKALMKNEDFKILDPAIPLKFVDLKYDIDDLEKDIKVYIDYRLGIFRELFLEISDKFLFSHKYGLDSYLSTRIRHGTLLGQIRTQFQEQNLITTKNQESNSYSTNEYWKDNLIGDNNKFQLLMSSFSKEIDDIISHLKDNIIQIKVLEQSSDELFDYYISDTEFYELYLEKFQDITNYDDFTNKVIDILWQKTEKNLLHVREYISNILKTRFVQLLTNLDRDLSSFIPRNSNPELFTNIATCKTKIQNELEKIKEWFYRRTLTAINFDINKVVDTCIAITNRLYNQNKIIFKEVHINAKSTFKGEYFIHFIDLFRIFFDNIINHASQNNTDSFTKIVIFEKGELLSVNIQNQLDKSINLEDLTRKLADLKERLNSSQSFNVITKKEGGSGFFKAKKILNYDLMDEDCDLNFYLNNNIFEVYFSLNISKLII